jgi:TonB family protein
MRALVLAALLATPLLQATKPDRNTVEAPRRIPDRTQARVEYTEEAIKANYYGTAHLSGIVEVDGQVTNIVLLYPVPHGLGENVIAYLKTWRFVPAKRDGEPYAVRVTFGIGLQPPSK